MMAAVPHAAHPVPIAAFPAAMRTGCDPDYSTSLPFCARTNFQLYKGKRLAARMEMKHAHPFVP